MNSLDRFAQRIINFAHNHSERIFLFFGVIVALSALGRAWWLAAHQPLLPKTHAPIPPISSSDRPLPSSAASAGQLAGAGIQVFKVPLPERFRGCWQGAAVLDSQQQLSSQWPAVKWSPRNYRLCFVEHGLDVWQVLYGENRIDSNGSSGFEKEQAVEFLRIERATAVLRTSVMLGSPPTGKYTTQEETTLRCELADAPGALRVRGEVVEDVNGKPWRAARWQGSFTRARETAGARGKRSQSRK
jgi:hypothetical protein